MFDRKIMKNREVLPEMLDSLPFADPAGIRSRRDLQRINRIGGNFKWLEKMLSRFDAFEGKYRILELGAGDGRFGLYLWQRHRSLNYTALDLAPRPDDFPAGLGWQQQNVLSPFEVGENDIVVANLFLHHFTDEQLGDIGKTLTKASVVIANEPQRHWVFRGLGYAGQICLGFNYVTRYDLHLSIRAGFRGSELADRLRLDKNRINRTEHSVFGFYRLVSATLQ